MLQTISIYKQRLINVIDDVIISIYHTGQTNMTTWAVQPTSWGNDLRSWADYTATFADAKSLAQYIASNEGEPATIFKCGTKSEFKWMEVR